MGSENSTWATLRDKLKNHRNVRMTRNEDKFDVGKPDVTFGIRLTEFNKVTGFIELKYLERWPPRAPIVKIKHYTQAQKDWLFDQGETGGCCFLFVQVGKEYFLFDYKQAQHIGSVPKDWWYKHNAAHWPQLMGLHALPLLVRIVSSKTEDI
ncbi:MAG: hypothetical protein COA47_10070 [Robiginitomaculum sp.]|nr:MAG: hypothetical protein COA47_10070 [Robiginitomaculum sp.]